jgi:hypothetical protein
LQGTLGASSAKRSRSKKNPSAESIEVVANNQASIAVPPPTPAAEPASVLAKPAQRRLAKPFSYPTLMALPVKIAIPLNEHDREFLNFSFLPCSNLSGTKQFNAFITYCNHSENHAVLVSRAFPSTTLSVLGAYLAIRQVHYFAATVTSSLTELTCKMLFPFSLHSWSAWNFQEDVLCWPVPC